ASSPRPARPSFAAPATARLSLRRDDAEVDQVLKPGDGVVVRSSSRLQGSLEARASSAFDGDPSTAWMPRFSGDPKPWLEAQLPAPVTFDRLDLTVVADKRHSLPARLRVETESGVVQVAVPSIANRSREGAT